MTEDGWGEYEQMLVEICEPGAGAAPMPMPPPASREEAPARVRIAPPPPPKEAPASPGVVALDPVTLEENRCAAFFPDAPEAIPYRVLRESVLRAAREKGGNAVMITSALPLEGKTLTAVNLALTFSLGCNDRTLLVDCDLARQMVHRTLGYESGRGLVDCLSGNCRFFEAEVSPGVEKLTVVSGGSTLPGGGALLATPGMAEAVKGMKGRFADGYVFFDAPPVLGGTQAQALALASLADHILFVVRSGSTPLDRAREALGMLPEEKVIGVVLNAQTGP